MTVSALIVAAFASTGENPTQLVATVTAESETPDPEPVEVEAGDIEAGDIEAVDIEAVEVEAVDDAEEVLVEVQHEAAVEADATAERQVVGQVDQSEANSAVGALVTTAVRENQVELIRAAGVAARAERLSPDPSRIVSIPGGLGGRPYAPGWMSGCDQMMFYARQFGLPEHFSRVGWRESRCRNYVSNGSHYGYLQINVNLHLRDHRTGPRYRQECGIHGVADIFGDTPIQKQRQMCAGAVIYQTVGRSAWVQTW